MLAWAVSLAFFITTLLGMQSLTLGTSYVLPSWIINADLFPSVMPSGFGKHLWDVTGTQLQGYLKVSENMIARRSCFLGIGTTG